jgi:hypothetical protein
MDFQQEQKFAEPYVIDPELESAIRYPGRADKHHVLAIGLLQFPRTHSEADDFMYQNSHLLHIMQFGHILYFGHIVHIFVKFCILDILRILDIFNIL